jgi:predicted RNase H-like HicB family nuclease
MCFLNLRGGRIILRKFRVILEPNELGGYTVMVPLLPGCISEGDTKKEALANIKEAIELYIESLQADGEPIPTEEAVEEAVVEVAA